MRHAGVYVCRPIRKHGERWSEHAFGNAIDVVGFDFARAPRKTSDAGVSLSDNLPSELRRPFQVRVATHWSAKADPIAQRHQQFLRKLTTTLRKESIFRAMIGPSDPNHRTHLHLDMGPWHYDRL